MSEDVSSQTTPDDVEALTSLATDDAGDAVGHAKVEIAVRIGFAVLCNRLELGRHPPTGKSGFAPLQNV